MIQTGTSTFISESTFNFRLTLIKLEFSICFLAFMLDLSDFCDILKIFCDAFTMSDLFSGGMAFE